MVTQVEVGGSRGGGGSSSHHSLLLSFRGSPGSPGWVTIIAAAMVCAFRNKRHQATLRFPSSHVPGAVLGAGA